MYINDLQYLGKQFDNLHFSKSYQTYLSSRRSMQMLVYDPAIEYPVWPNIRATNKHLFSLFQTEWLKEWQ